MSKKTSNRTFSADPVNVQNDSSARPQTVLLENATKFPQWTGPFFNNSPIAWAFWHESHAKSWEKILRSLNSFFRGLLAPLKIMQKSFSDGQGGTCFEKCKLFFFVQMWHLLKSCKNNFPMVRDFFVLRSVNYFFRGFVTPSKNMKIHPGRPALKSKNPGTMLRW